MKALTKRAPGIALPAAAEPEQPALTGKKQKKQQALVAVMRYMRRLRAELGSDALNPAVQEFQQQFAKGMVPAAILSAIATLAPKKPDRCPDRATFYRWDGEYTRYLNGDATAGAPKHKGGQRKAYGWEARALALYHIPSKPEPGGVADKLREEGWESATNDRVLRFLKSMPATLGPNSKYRVGKHYFRQNLGRYVSRDTSCLEVGEVYSMDGHTVDVYMAHPFSGGIWRPELTVVMDIRSRFLPGWYLSEAESASSSMLALSHALTSQDHVPAWLHVDNGAGFKARAMADEAVGFYRRFDIEVMFSIPGNSKGRGHIERLFRTVRDKHDKFFADGQFYCGGDMAPEINRRLHDQIKPPKVVNGKPVKRKLPTRILPSFYAYRDSIAAWIERYNNTPHSALDGRTPAEVWAELKRVPVELPAEATWRERQLRTVARGKLTLDKRDYFHPDLALYEGKLPVEYSIHDDAHVWVYDNEDRLICIAELVSKADYLPASRLEEKRAKRTEERKKRLYKKVAEVDAQHAASIPYVQRLEAIEELVEGQPLQLGQLEKKTADWSEPAVPEAPVSVVIDPYDTSYLD